jgi:hypothetical protein
MKLHENRKTKGCIALICTFEPLFTGGGYFTNQNLPNKRPEHQETEVHCIQLKIQSMNLSKKNTIPTFVVGASVRLVNVGISD